MVASKVRLYSNIHTSYYFFVFVFYNRSVAFPRCKVTVEVKIYQMLSGFSILSSFTDFDREILSPVFLEGPKELTDLCGQYIGPMNLL